MKKPALSNRQMGYVFAPATFRSTYRTLGHPANLDVQSPVFSQNCKSQECLMRSAIFYSAMLAVVIVSPGSSTLRHEES